MKFLLLLSILALTGCGVRSIPQAQNAVEAEWAEVQNQYKRRADLIPNLVSTVKGYAKHEEGTLTAVVEARAKATAVTIDASKLNAQNMKAFQEAQGQLSSALGRLLAVAENYPQLKASENFQALQSQLEGTENRITIARRRFIEAVQGFNNLVSVFPTNLTNSLFFHYEKKPQFSATEEEQKTPQVQF